MWRMLKGNCSSMWRGFGLRCSLWNVSCKSFQQLDFLYQLPAEFLTFKTLISCSLLKCSLNITETIGKNQLIFVLGNAYEGNMAGTRFIFRGLCHYCKYLLRLPLQEPPPFPLKGHFVSPIGKEMMQVWR